METLRYAENIYGPKLIYKVNQLLELIAAIFIEFTDTDNFLTCYLVYIKQATTRWISCSIPSTWATFS